MEQKSKIKIFKEKAANIHNGKFSYDKTLYIHSKKKVIITCPIHGDFEQRPDTHLEGKGCPRCKCEQVSIRFKSDTLKFIEKSNIIYNNFYDYSKTIYKDVFTKVCIICPFHGEFYQSPARHIEGRGCQQCKRDKNGKNKTIKAKEKFKHESKIIHGDKYNYSKFIYISSRTKGIIICYKHGEFKQTPNNHLKGKGCPICSSSKGELSIKEILDKYKIKYMQEYKIPNQVYKFRYDFFLVELNILIEFHGIQHYKAKEFFGGEEALQDNLRRDMFKRELAKLLNITLLEFNYKQLKYLSKEQFELLVISDIRRKL